jgi:hypothetical protein
MTLVNQQDVGEMAMKEEEMVAVSGCWLWNRESWLLDGLVC